MNYKKSEFCKCTICGLPRGKGPHEFAHGKCMEILAKNESKKVAGVVIDGIPTRITVEHKKKARSNATVKKYRSGNLPSWMYT